MSLYYSGVQPGEQSLNPLLITNSSNSDFSDHFKSAQEQVHGAPMCWPNTQAPDQSVLQLFVRCSATQSVGAHLHLAILGSMQPITNKRADQNTQAWHQLHFNFPAAHQCGHLVNAAISGSVRTALAHAPARTSTPHETRVRTVSRLSPASLHFQ